MLTPLRMSGGASGAVLDMANGGAGAVADDGPCGARKACEPLKVRLIKRNRSIMRVWSDDDTQWHTGLLMEKFGCLLLVGLRCLCVPYLDVPR